MLQRIQAFFERNLAPNRPGEPDEQAIQRATAALLIEVARQDETVTADELEAVTSAIRRKFGLNPTETQELIALASEELAASTDYFQFTSLIRERFSPEQKVRVIEHLWEVAFADGRIDRYEEHMVRKIADLLYVPHSDFVAAKHRAGRAG